MTQNAWYLTVQQGPNAGNSHPVRGATITIGRHPDNQIVLDDAMVSRHHARLTWQGDGYVVQDLDSANGTWVNGRRIHQPTPLRPGDTLGLSEDIVLGLSSPGPVGLPTYVVPQRTAARSRPIGLWLAIGGLVITVAAIAVVAFLLLWDNGEKDAGTLPTAASATAGQEVVVVTATPSLTVPPADTSAPAPQPTDTALPTATPTDAPTQTPPATYTLYPTYTPYPTQEPPTPKPAQPTNTPQPTATAQPTATSRPPYTVAINKVEPEPWGRPTNPDGCNGPYNDRDPVKRVTIEVVVTNQSNRTIPDGWYPVFYSAQGKTPKTCVWDYGDTSVQPGETTYVTFATHVELNDWVQRLVLDELGYQVVVCFNSSGQVVACP